MANRGQAIEILDENNNILYPRTNANNVYFGDTGKMVGTVLGDAVVDIGNLQTKTNNLDTEVSEARNSPTTNYPTLKTRLDDMENECNEVKKEVSDARGVGNATLKDRLDKMQDQINAGGGGGGATIQEVIDARTDNVSTPNVTHGSLGDRLDSMQTVINNHLALAHITYREIVPYHAVITTHDEIAIVTDDGKGIEKTGNVTKTTRATTKAAPTDSIKITQLTNKKPTDDDLLVIETAQGTASTKVSDLPFNIKYTIV